MAVPRTRTSNSKKNSRSANLALKAKSLSNCSNCLKTKLPHTICPYCGFYAKKPVILINSVTKK